MSLRKKNDGFVGLKSKIYSIKDEIQKENRESKKRKGFNSIAVNNIKHKEYLDVLFNKKVVRHVEFKVNCIKLKLMVFLRFHCLVLTIKDTYQMMVLIVGLIFIKIQEIIKIRQVNEINEIK